MNRKKLRWILYYICIFQSFFSYANPLIENILHIDARATSEEFFTSDNKGFISSFSKQKYDFYQFSSLPIQFFALNPINDEIAIYETDNSFFHQITVWNWKTKEKRFSKKLSDSVLKVAYSAQGSTLIVATQSVKGVYFFNANDGRERQILQENTGIITFAKSSSTERNLILYSPQGVLSYYDFKTGKKRAQFETEKNLTDISLYSDNRFLLGRKSSSIYKIQATTGKTVQTYKTQTPAIFSFETDFAYLKKEENAYDIFFDKDENAAIFEFALKENDSIKKGFSTNNSIFLLTKKNNFHILDINEVFLSQKENKHNLNPPILEPMPLEKNEKLLDFAFSTQDNQKSFALTAGNLYSFDNQTDSLTWIVAVEGFTNILSCAQNLVFYKKNTRTPIATSTITQPSAITELYKPQAPIQSVSAFDENIAILESHNLINIYNIEAEKVVFSYKGTGFQDILLVGNDLYIAKSSATQPNSALIVINISTGETLPLAIKGNIAFSLALSKTALTGNSIVGFSAEVKESSKDTQLFVYSPQTKQFSYFTPFNDDAFNASTSISDTDIYSTHNKFNLLKINRASKKITTLSPRSKGIPIKVMINDTDIVTLTSNGTCYVYDLPTGNFLRELSINEQKRLIITY
ncbi:MAG: hypothetical protein ACRC4W_07135 [Treponemataceae bacterium]